jgi:hypothetical protein
VRLAGERVRSTASLLLAVFLSSAFLASCSSNGYGQAAAVSAVQPPRSSGRTAQTYVSEETPPCDDVLVQCNGIGSVVVSMGGGGFSITTIPASSVVDPFANGVQSTTRDLTIRAYYQSGLFFLECGDIFRRCRSERRGDRIERRSTRSRPFDGSDGAARVPDHLQLRDDVAGAKQPDGEIDECRTKCDSARDMSRSELGLIRRKARGVRCTRLQHQPFIS